MDISNAWGYAAIIVPRKKIWQGFVVFDPADPAVHAQVTKAIAAASMHEGRPAGKSDQSLAVEGILSACLADAFFSGRQDGVAIFSSALAEVLGHRYFVVDVIEQKDHLLTTASTLKSASTPEAARDAINSRVMPLKLGRLIEYIEAVTARASAAQPNAGEPDKTHDGGAREP